MPHCMSEMRWMVDDHFKPDVCRRSASRVFFRSQIKMSKSWLWVKLRGFRFCLTEIWGIIQCTMGWRDDTLMTLRVWFGCCMSNYSNQCGVCGTENCVISKRKFSSMFSSDDGPAQQCLAFDAWCHTQGRSATCLNNINQNDKYMRQMICQSQTKSPNFSREQIFHRVGRDKLIIVMRFPCTFRFRPRPTPAREIWIKFLF